MVQQYITCWWCPVGASRLPVANVNAVGVGSPALLQLKLKPGGRQLATTAGLLSHLLTGEDGHWAFHTVPEVLMLQMPRFGSIEKGYERIFPNQHLTIPVTTTGKRSSRGLQVRPAPFDPDHW